MALCASGEMALGGSTTGRSVNLELARSFNSGICMNETAVRTLAGVPSGQICMNNFYGKSNAPTTLGEFYEGGYYTGVIDIGGGVTYYLLVAPNATGCSNCLAWKNTRTVTAGTSSAVNGYSNTWGPLNNTTHPAGNYTATRSISGYADWYLPATTEMSIMYNNKGSMPAGEGYNLNYYWSSRQCDAVYAYVAVFSTGLICPGGGYINCNQRVRAVRRKKT